MLIAKYVYLAFVRLKSCNILENCMEHLCFQIRLIVQVTDNEWQQKSSSCDMNVTIKFTFFAFLKYNTLKCHIYLILNRKLLIFAEKLFFVLSYLLPA